MAYRTIEDQLIEQARNSAMLSDDEIRERIAIVAREWGVPIAAEDVSVTRNNERVAVAAQWDVLIRHFGLYDHRLHFAAAADELALPFPSNR